MGLCYPPNLKYIKVFALGNNSNGGILFQEFFHETDVNLTKFSNFFMKLM